MVPSRLHVTQNTLGSGPIASQSDLRMATELKLRSIVEDRPLGVAQGVCGFPTRALSASMNGCSEMGCDWSFDLLS